MAGQQAGWASGSRRQTEEDLFERDLFGYGGALPRSPSPRRSAYGIRPQWRGSVREDWESQETVQGVDNRVQVLARPTNPSTTLFPFNTICHMDQGTVNASGTLIAPRVVLTAGHVVSGLSSVGVTPGANFPAPNPADRRPANPGSQTAPSSTFRFHPSLDLALVLLPAAFTRPTRFMMLQPRGDLNTATLLTIAGYPRVAPPPQNVPIPGSMAAQRPAAAHGRVGDAPQLSDRHHRRPERQSALAARQRRDSTSARCAHPGWHSHQHRRSHHVRRDRLDRVDMSGGVDHSSAYRRQRPATPGLPFRGHAVI